MPGPVYLTQPNIIRLPQLLQEIRKGEIRIPRFQRPFVWTPEQRLLLFDSIYRGMPIGSILVWRTGEHDLQSYSHLGHLPLTASRDEDSSDGVKQYLLDGHQRLTTLYSTLGQGLRDEEGDPSASEVTIVGQDDGEADSWIVYFDLENRGFELHTRQSSEPPQTWLPLSILFNPFQLYEFQKHLLEADVSETLVHRAEALASTFKDYNIPMVPIVTDDLDLVTESFQRVNSAGTDMDQVHMVSALTWTADFDLNERMQEIQEELGQEGWQDLEEKIILNTCKAALGLDVYRSEVRAIQMALKKDPEVLDRATRSLLEAARFLRESCMVYGPATLPYSFQVILLAEAIRLGTQDLQQDLSPDLMEALRQWFWITTYTEYFASINSTRLSSELDHLRGVASQGEDPRPPGLPNNRVRATRRFDFRAARSRALSLRLAELSEKPEQSFRLLAEHGRDAAPMLVPSRKVRDREIAQEPANRVVISPTELPLLRQQLLQDPLDCDPQILERHAIPQEAARALAQRGWRAFVEYRRRRLDEIEKEFVEDLGLEYVVE